MRCPFLREAQVKYCQSSSIKKMIVRASNDSLGEKCSSSDYVNCPSLKQYHEDSPQQARCPFLQESLVQYCGASAVPKYVPYSESSIIRCGNDSHRYCELFLSVAGQNQNFSEISQGTIVDAVHLPAHLGFYSNHMWIDQTEDGMCHIGVDEFLTKYFHQIDAINFLPSNGSKLPVVVLTINGVDLQLTFPLPVNITGMNSYLRANPQKLISHPYSAGWLFEGSLSEIKDSESISLMRGAEAVSWMKQEVQHLNEYVHNQIIPNQNIDASVMMDGGIVHPEIIEHLNKQELLNLLNELFSPYANWRKT